MWNAFGVALAGGRMTRHRPGPIDPVRMTPPSDAPACAGAMLSSESRWDRRVPVTDVTLAATVAQAARGAAVRAATGAAATPTPRLPQAELRPQIAHFSPLLACALFMSRTVHPPTAGKPAQVLGRAARKTGARPVRSGALSAPTGARSSGSVTGRQIEASRPRGKGSVNGVPSPLRRPAHDANPWGRQRLRRRSSPPRSRLTRYMSSGAVPEREQGTSM